MRSGTFFPRAEIYSGFSFDEFNKIRGILRRERIRYTDQIVPAAQPTRERHLSVSGTDSLFYLYVKKRDYSAARLAVDRDKARPN